MNDQMFIKTPIITSSFFAIAVVLVLSALPTERIGQLHSAAETDQFWLHNTQITRGFQGNGFIQHVCIEGDFIRSFGEQGVGNQFESWMEVERGDRAEDTVCEFVDFRRVGQRGA